jgi:uncharacterized membrane protein
MNLLESTWGHASEPLMSVEGPDWIWPIQTAASYLVLISWGLGCFWLIVNGHTRIEGSKIATISSKALLLGYSPQNTSQVGGLLPLPTYIALSFIMKESWNLCNLKDSERMAHPVGYCLYQCWVVIKSTNRPQVVTTWVMVLRVHECGSQLKIKELILISNHHSKKNWK